MAEIVTGIEGKAFRRVRMFHVILKSTGPHLLVNQIRKKLLPDVKKTLLTRFFYKYKIRWINSDQINEWLEKSKTNARFGTNEMVPLIAIDDAEKFIRNLVSVNLIKIDPVSEGSDSGAAHVTSGPVSSVDIKTESKQLSTSTSQDSTGNNFTFDHPYSKKAAEAVSSIGGNPALYPSTPRSIIVDETVMPLRKASPQEPEGLVGSVRPVAESSMPQSSHATAVYTTIVSQMTETSNRSNYKQIPNTRKQEEDGISCMYKGGMNKEGKYIDEQRQAIANNSDVIFGLKPVTFSPNFKVKDVKQDLTYAKTNVNDTPDMCKLGKSLHINTSDANAPVHKMSYDNKNEKDPASHTSKFKVVASSLGRDLPCGLQITDVRTLVTSWEDTTKELITEDVTKQRVTEGKTKMLVTENSTKELVTSDNTLFTLKMLPPGITPISPPEKRNAIQKFLPIERSVKKESTVQRNVSDLDSPFTNSAVSKPVIHRDVPLKSFSGDDVLKCRDIGSQRFPLQSSADMVITSDSQKILNYMDETTTVQSPTVVFGNCTERPQMTSVKKRSRQSKNEQSRISFGSLSTMNCKRPKLGGSEDETQECRSLSASGIIGKQHRLSSRSGSEKQDGINSFNPEKYSNPNAILNPSSVASHRNSQEPWKSSHFTVGLNNDPKPPTPNFDKTVFPSESKNTLNGSNQNKRDRPKKKMDCSNSKDIFQDLSTTMVHDGPKEPCPKRRAPTMCTDHLNLPGCYEDSSLSQRQNAEVAANILRDCLLAKDKHTALGGETLSGNEPALNCYFEPNAKARGCGLVTIDGHELIYFTRNERKCVLRLDVYKIMFPKEKGTFGLSNFRLLRKRYGILQVELNEQERKDIRRIKEGNKICGLKNHSGSYSRVGLLLDDVIKLYKLYKARRGEQPDGSEQCLSHKGSSPDSGNNTSSSEKYISTQSCKKKLYKPKSATSVSANLVTRTKAPKIDKDNRATSYQKTKTAENVSKPYRHYRAPSTTVSEKLGKVLEDNKQKQTQNDFSFRTSKYGHPIVSSETKSKLLELFSNQQTEYLLPDSTVSTPTKKIEARCITPPSKNNFSYLIGDTALPMLSTQNATHTPLEGPVHQPQLRLPGKESIAEARKSSAFVETTEGKSGRPATAHIKYNALETASSTPPRRKSPLLPTQNFKKKFTSINQSYDSQTTTAGNLLESQKPNTTDMQGLTSSEDDENNNEKKTVKDSNHVIYTGSETESNWMGRGREADEDTMSAFEDERLHSFAAVQVDSQASDQNAGPMDVTSSIDIPFIADKNANIFINDRNSTPSPFQSSSAAIRCPTTGFEAGAGISGYLTRFTESQSKIAESVVSLHKFTTQLSDTHEQLRKELREEREMIRQLKMQIRQLEIEKNQVPPTEPEVSKASMLVPLFGPQNVSQVKSGLPYPERLTATTTRSGQTSQNTTRSTALYSCKLTATSDVCLYDPRKHVTCPGISTTSRAPYNTHRSPNEPPLQAHRSPVGAASGKNSIPVLGLSAFSPMLQQNPRPMHGCGHYSSLQQHNREPVGSTREANHQGTRDLDGQT